MTNEVGAEVSQQMLLRMCWILRPVYIVTVIIFSRGLCFLFFFSLVTRLSFDKDSVIFTSVDCTFDFHQIKGPDKVNDVWSGFKLEVWNGFSDGSYILIFPFTVMLCWNYICCLVFVCHSTSGPGTTVFALCLLHYYMAFSW